VEVVTCEEIARMMAIHIPDEVVIQTLVGEREPGEPAECVAGLPEAVQAAFLALPVAAPPTPDPAPLFGGLPPEPQPAPLAPGAVRNIVDPIVLDAVRSVYDLPDPGQAAALGGLVGFGAGQAHAQDWLGGALFAVVDVTIVGLLAAGAGGAIVPTPETTATLSVSLLASHFVQIGIAGPSARRRAQQILQEANH
jgi:hypothetical protein